MNKYEQRFLEAFHSTKSDIVSLEGDIKKSQSQIKELEGKILGVTQAQELIQDETASGALIEAIKKLGQQVSAAKSRIEGFEKRLVEKRLMLDVIKLLCPHDKRVFDHEDYHKREEYYRCVLCGDLQ